MPVGVETYPTTLDTLTTLMRVVNEPAAGWPTLRLPCGVADYTLTVTDGSIFPADGAVIIDKEVIYFSSVANNILTVEAAGRGADGTARVAHAAGSEVRSVLSARTHAVLAAAIIATQDGAVAVAGDTMTGPLNVTSLTGTTLGVFSVDAVARASAYTQTFSTADKTHAADSSADLATTGVTQTTPFGFAGAAQGDNIATQFNLLRATVADLKQLVNSVIDDLQAYGFLS